MLKYFLRLNIQYKFDLYWFIWRISYANHVMYCTTERYMKDPFSFFNISCVSLNLTCQTTNSRYSKKFTIRLTEFHATLV